MPDVVAAYKSVRQRADAAAKRAARDPAGVRILSVTKKQPSALINELLDAFGPAEIMLGENYVQECKRKLPELKFTPGLHLIGPLQRNKAKDAVKIFDVIESVHSFELMQALNQAAKGINKVQSIFLQVNVSRDFEKSGFDESDLEVVFENITQLGNIKLCGFMTITRLYEEPEMARPDFKRLREIRERFGKVWSDPLELSMGMSSDFEIAIEEGASIVRIGTLIFGER